MSIPEHETRAASFFVTGFFQGLTVLLLFISLLYGQRELVLLALLVLAMFNGSWIWCRLSLFRVNCRLDADTQKGFPGETISLRTEITNAKCLPVRVQLKVPASEALFLCTGEKALSGACSLPWYGRSVRQWKLTAQSRGFFQVGPPSVEVGDLFGFFRQKKSFSETVQVVIYPRLVPLRDFSPPLEELFGKPGLSSPVSDPIYMVSTRDYRSAAPARHIHWKASARHNRLQEKVFEPSGQHKTLMVIDVESFSREVQAESFERTLEVAAAMAVEIDRRGGTYGLLSNGTTAGGYSTELPPGGGPRQLNAALEMLARLQPDPREALHEALPRKSRVPAGISCIYFTYRLDESAAASAAVLKQLHIPTVYIYDSEPDFTWFHIGRICLLKELHGESIRPSVKQEARVQKEG